MIWHEAESVNIDKRFPYTRRLELSKTMVRIDIVQVVESIQVVYKTHTIGVVQDDFSFLYAAIQEMIDFHLSILKYGHAVSIF
jgi:hypothetical protein